MAEITPPTDTPVEDFVHKEFDKLIEAEFSDDKLSPPEKKAKKREEPPEEESNVDLTKDGNEDDEDETQDDKETDKTEKDETAEAEKTRPKSAIANARAEYKELFKKHPDIEANYFAAKEYQQHFASPKEAAEAAEKVEFMDEVIATSIKGDPTMIIQTLAEVDQEGFARFALSFLPTLNEMAPKLVNRIIQPAIVNMLASVAKVAESRGDKDLLLAVRYIHNEVFGSDDVPQAIKVGKFIKDDKEIKEKELELERKAGDAFYESVSGLLEPIIEAKIVEHLTQRSGISPELRETVVEKTKKILYEVLGANKSHTATMKTLYKAAKANGFSMEYKKRVARLVLDEALEIIPDLARKVENRVVGNVKVPKETKENRDEALVHNNGNSSTRGNRKEFNVDDIDTNRTSLRTMLDVADNTADPKKVKYKGKA